MTRAVLVLALAGAFTGPMMAPTPVAGQEARSDVWAGEWLMTGDANRPCAIFRHGSVLLVINEHGSIGSGRVTSAQTFVILKGEGWQTGLTAELHDEGKTIVWGNSSKWRRR